MGGQKPMGGFLPQQIQHNRRQNTRAGGHLPWIVDTAVVFIVWAAVLEFNPWTRHEPRPVLVLASFAAMLQLAVGLSRGRYVEVPRPSRTDEVASTIIATMVSVASVPLAAEVLNWNDGARELVLGTLVVMPVLGVTGEVRRSRRRIRSLEPVVIVGTGQEAREVAELLTDHPETGIRFVGVVGDRATADRHDLGALWIGSTERLISTMEKYGTTTAIVAPNSFRSSTFRNVVDTLLDNGFDVALSSGISRIGVHRHMVTDVVHEPLVLLQPATAHSWHHKAKRASDVAGALFGVLASLPVLLVAAVAIKIQDGGPIFYYQERVGRGVAGHGVSTFRMWKLRTMKVDAEKEQEALAAENERNGPLFKVTKDRRITPIGRLLRELSIDELPQLWNVLKGHMSIVGPRPALPAEVEKFDEELQGRASVRPGLTGLWQVEARTNASFSAYRRLDLHYIDNWTFWLDLKIMLATVQLLVVGLALKAARTVIRRTEPAVDGVDASISLADFKVAEPAEEPHEGVAVPKTFDAAS